VAAHLIAVGVTGTGPWQSGADRASAQADADHCVECDVPISGWGCWYSDGLGELVPYCPSCAQREFGTDADGSVTRTAAA
jgi:hypothetical protein